MMHLLEALFFFLSAGIIGLIPFFLLYRLSGLVAILLHRVFGYRRKVVKENLNRAFPDMNPDERKRVEKQFYRNLSDILLEGIRSFTMSRRSVIKRHHVEDPKGVLSFLNQNRSIIALPAHITNWEWGSLSGSLQIPYTNVVFYKPLNNPYVDRFVRWSRGRVGTTLVSISVTPQTFAKLASDTVVYVMAADQSPTRQNKIEWVDFLGQKTAFLYGPEKYARKYNLPVFYVDIRRIRRGHYSLLFKLLSDNPRDLPQGEIIRRYAAEIEKSVLREPGSWLWSHRRWKLNPQD
ncbi:MAG: lysophospholipid acyltransferase family protein [Bacteroidales bacterium]